jgi:CheY-like chemotaxis protein
MKTVLVVDDDATTRSVLKNILEAFPVAVMEAEDGQAAVDMCATVKVDLAIVDMFLPRKGGLDVIKELGAAYPPMCFIAISGGHAFDPREVLALSRIMNVDNALAKPIDREAALGLIGRLLESCDRSASSGA